MVECKDGSKFNAVITIIGSDMVSVYIYIYEKIDRRNVHVLIYRY